MLDILFLGTGAGMPSKQRNVTSIALKLLAERNEIWLFDCGEATQHQILHTSLKPRKVEKIFITHLHGDHIYGLPGFISSRAFLGGETPLTVYGPKGIKDFVMTALKISQTYLKYDLYFHEFENGEVVFEDATFKVEAEKLEHGISSFGYRITEKDKRGELLVDKLKELGIKPGPIYRQIKEGLDITLEDGSIISASTFVGPQQRGKVVTILGDTRYCEGAIQLAMDSDVLVHEATFAAGENELASSYYHSTTEQAAMVAKEANVKQLICTHISSRYDLKGEEQLLQQLKLIFPNSMIAADLLDISI